MDTRVNVFHAPIQNWQDWSQIFQSIEIFAPLIQEIFKNEHLTYTTIEKLEPGTNAVFKVGKYIIKIFVPIESGVDTYKDYLAEKAGIEWAKERQVNAPQLITIGEIKDKYLFRYIILLHIESKSLASVLKNCKNKDKVDISRKLRCETDKLNVSCDILSPLDLIERELNNPRWKKFNETFYLNRQNYLRSKVLNKVGYVHGDLNGDNVLMTDEQLYIIDFADGLIAPMEYEWALVMLELFHFDPYCLEGYFGKKSKEEYIDICLEGLLIHDYGADVFIEYLKDVDHIHTIEDLRVSLYVLLDEIFKNRDV